MVQKSGGHQLRLVVYPIIYRVWYILGGARFLPSTVVSVDEIPNDYKHSSFKPYQPHYPGKTLAGVWYAVPQDINRIMGI